MIRKCFGMNESNRLFFILMSYRMFECSFSSRVTTAELIIIMACHGVTLYTTFPFLLSHTLPLTFHICLRNIAFLFLFIPPFHCAASGNGVKVVCIEWFQVNQWICVKYVMPVSTLMVKLILSLLLYCSLFLYLSWDAICMYPREYTQHTFLRKTVAVFTDGVWCGGTG